MTSVCAPDAAASMEQVGQVFQNIHRSAANTQKCRKELLRLAKSDEAHCIEAVCQVLLLVLKQSPQLTSDALRRHYAFLGEMGKAFREALSSDALSIAIMRLMLPYHNANEKLVRLAVVSTIEVLLRSVDQSNTSDERQEFYQEVAEVLKQRVHDRFASVREKAVIAISAFQSGKKDCDVAQHLIALLCTDNNADVRQQILHAIAPRKEFLEGYFHGMMRSTRDAVARVRAEAWDALGRFPWRYITAYAVAKHISLSERLSQGLTDSSPSVVAACRAAMTNGWLHRDCAEKCEALLDPIVMGNVLATLEPMDIICAEVLAYFRKRSPLRHFTIDLSDVHTAALLMWRTEAKLAGDAEGEDESQLLPPLEQFCAMLQDTVYAYARPDAPAKVMTFRTTEDADNMLRVLLSAFEVYEDNAYLAHADNTTRNGLLRLLNFLLKVVPDDDPALFVDVAVRSIKSLTARTPEEATTTVTTALDSLFRSLKLPQRHGLGFDDVEALARKSRERQQELVKRKVQARSGDAPQEKYDELKAEMDRDEKFLLRMQLIVLAFLSHSQRGDDIPVFCSHIIQLGRQQDNESVQVAATKSLGLQCLISPDSVHTFMPLLVADTRQLQRNNNTTTNNNNNNHMSESVPLAAMGVIFDLLMEYGLKFFDVPPSAAPREEHAYNVENPSEARLHHEHELAVEDVHKVGGRHLLHDILATLAPELCPTTHALTIVGLCKLLSCNRIAPDDTSMVLSHLLLHFMRVQQEKKMKEMSAYLADYLAKFCRSYAASHSKRQEELATAGVAAFRLLLPHHAAMAMKLMDVVLPMSDAYILGSIREIDPEAAKRANKAMADANDEENSAGAGGKATSTTTASTSARSTITRGSLQGGRLLRELSRCSLHERMAQELLVELAEAPSRESRSACLAALQRMYFYSVDSQAYLHFCGKMAMNALETGDGTLREQLRSWLEEVARQHKDAVAASPGAEADFAVQWANAVRDRLARVQCLQLYVDDDARFFERELPVREVVKAEPTHGSGVGVKREREREDYFDVESIIGKRGGKHQR